MVAWGHEATRDEPGYGDTAEFHSAGIEIAPYGKPRQYEDIDPNSMGPASVLYWWADAFVADQQAELIADAADLEQGEREAAADRRREERRDNR